MDKKFEVNPNTVERMEAFYAKLVNKTERFNDWMMPHLIPLIPKTGDILDIGCGMGRTLDEVREYSDANLYGTDISPTAIEEAQKRYPEFTFKVEDATIPMSDKYDMIINSQTLEHVDDPKTIILNMKDALKEDGILFITVPWPKSSLDNGVKLHHWRFYPEDFKEILGNEAQVIKADKRRMVVIYKK